MPFSTIAAIRDTIYTTFKVAWDAQTPPIPVVVYGNDVRSDAPTTGSSPWVKAVVTFNDSSQATLGGIGARRFRRYGIFTAGVRTPVGDGQDAADAYMQALYDAFEGKESAPDGVWFRRARQYDDGREGAWLLTTFLVEFEADVIK